MQTFKNKKKERKEGKKSKADKRANVADESQKFFCVTPN